MRDIRQTARHRCRGPGRLAGLLMALLVILGLSAGPAIAAPDGKAEPAQSTVRVPARAMDAVAAMQPSWNLGNTLDAIPDETSWGNPKVTKDLFDTIRAQGYRSVRIPVTWTDHQSATAPYTIDATFMSASSRWSTGRWPTACTLRWSTPHEANTAASWASCPLLPVDPG